MLGQEVVRQLDTLRLLHIDSDMDCDITDTSAVARFASDRHIKWIVNCSAYTAVDRAEDEEAKADAVNAIGPANLGRVAAELGARTIHLSTDYVFDGEASSPIVETTQPAPKGAYGRTKLRGENLLTAATPDYFIIRTAWLYGVQGKNFVYTMLRLMNEQAEVSVVDDQHGTPTYARDLAAALCSIITDDSHAYGIYHYTNEGETTWFQFARAIYDFGKASGRVKNTCDVTPTTTDRYPTKAVRPRYSVLSKQKIRETFGVSIPTWQDGLERFFRELDEEGIA
jgi:dTDP-4-dehydrorhamnose reductase